MKHSGYRKLLCELSKLNAFILLGYKKKNTDASILVYKHHPKRTGFNMYAENTQQQLTLLAIRYRTCGFKIITFTVNSSFKHF